MSDALKVLKAAREIIGEPKRWTPGSMGLDKHGCGTLSTGPDAVAWCAMGSLQKAAHTLGYAPYTIVVQDASDLIFPFCQRNSVTYVNDVLGHVAILRAMDQAISQEESKAA